MYSDYVKFCLERDIKPATETKYEETLDTISSAQISEPYMDSLATEDVLSVFMKEFYVKPEELE